MGADARPRSERERTLLERITSRGPTRYRVEPEGDVAEQAPSFVYCAYDAFLVALLRERAVRLHAQPPGAAAFEVVLAAEAAGGAAGPWLTFVTPAAALPDAPGMPSRRCPYMHLFVEREDAERWRATLPDALAAVVEVLPLDEAWDRAGAQVAAVRDGA